MICNGCGEDKPEEAFRLEKNGRRRKTCRRCRSKQVQEWRRRTGYQSPNAKETDRRSKMLNLYGITVEEADRLIAAGCAVCEVKQSPNGKRLSIDHCHQTGKVRGALCGPCNLALGALQEDPERARRLADYAEERCRVEV